MAPVHPALRWARRAKVCRRWPRASGNTRTRAWWPPRASSQPAPAGWKLICSAGTRCCQTASCCKRSGCSHRPLSWPPRRWRLCRQEFCTHGPCTLRTRSRRPMYPSMHPTMPPTTHPTTAPAIWTRWWALTPSSACSGPASSTRCKTRHAPRCTSSVVPAAYYCMARPAPARPSSCGPWRASWPFRCTPSRQPRCCRNGWVSPRNTWPACLPRRASTPRR